MGLRRIWPLAGLVFLFLTLGQAQGAGFTYDRIGHPGGDLTPGEAYQRIVGDPQNTILVDVRTRAEYVYVGHPAMALNLPIQFFNARPGEKGMGMVFNSRFGQELRERVGDKATILFICRSGNRSVTALNAALEAGFDSDRLFNVLGGFEGDRIKNPHSLYQGQRRLGGWRNEGLPWTYDLDRRLVY